TRGGRDRVPRQGSGLVDRADRSEVGHHVGAAAEGRGRETAAHHLPERHQVGRPALCGPVEAPLPRRRYPEAGHHLVAHERRATISSASAPSGAAGVPNDVPAATALVTASTTSGCACPRMSGPHEHTRSTYSLPSTS